MDEEQVELTRELELSDPSLIWRRERRGTSPSMSMSETFTGPFPAHAQPRTVCPECPKSYVTANKRILS